MNQGKAFAWTFPFKENESIVFQPMMHDILQAAIPYYSQLLQNM